MGRSTLAYLLSIPALAVFAWGVYSRLSFWFSGCADDVPPGEERPGQAALGFRGAWKKSAAVIFSAKIFPILRSVFIDAILARRLFRLSKVRWAIHALMLYGFGTLLVADAFATRLELMGGYDKDIPALALAFELGGLAMIAGVALALGRRLIIPEERLRGAPGDYVAPVLAGLVLVTGYLTEAFRLLAENVSPALGGYSFAGLAIANLFDVPGANWAFIHDAVWLVHVLLSFGFIAYIPYGKFFHFMVAPLIAGMNAGANAMGDR
jgi:nitrate reductase gamma subunit